MDPMNPTKHNEKLMYAKPDSAGIKKSERNKHIPARDKEMIIQLENTIIFPHFVWSVWFDNS